jgi:hypothetical protein
MMIHLPIKAHLALCQAAHEPEELCKDLPFILLTVMLDIDPVFSLSVSLLGSSSCILRLFPKGL